MSCSRRDGMVLAPRRGMNPSSKQDILRRIQELGPFQSAADAVLTLHATLEALGSLLTEGERLAVAGSLPAECARLVRGAPSTTRGNVTDFFHRVATREGAALGRAVEHAEIACRALGETLSPSALARLQRAVPDLARLFEPAPEPAPPPPHREAPGDVPRDLAEGRPGGERPLADADPHELAHRQSIARSDDPHAETKLSSACGLTQEREARTLAAGRPGSSRPLSRSH